MTDKKKLKAAMVLAGENQTTLAKKLGMFPTSLNYRINGRLDFKAGEIEKVAKILHLTPDEIIAIFFTSEVDKMPTDEPEEEE